MHVALGLDTPLAVATTVAVFVPVVEYALVQVEPVPEQSPVHKYVYEPVPPEAVAVNVVEFPVLIELGEAEQETVGAVVGVVLQLVILQTAPPAPPSFNLPAPDDVPS